MAILFFSEGLNFNLPNPRLTSSWIKKVVKKEKSKLESVNYIFCSDDYLATLNSQYLKHNTLTDIITFDFSEGKAALHGEIYVSIDRVKENAIKFKTTFDIELHRVIIHGILHLLGYNDKKGVDKALMREKEEAYLSLR